MEIEDLIITEYLVENGRKPIALRRHNTKEGVKWGVWKGVTMMLTPEGRWRYPDRRALKVEWMMNSPEEALALWQKFGDVEVWR